MAPRLALSSNDIVIFQLEAKTAEFGNHKRLAAPCLTVVKLILYNAAVELIIVRLQRIKILHIIVYVKIIVHFLTLESVIPRCYNVCSAVEKQIGAIRENTVSFSGIFAVYNGKINGVFAPYFRQVL